MPDMKSCALELFDKGYNIVPVLPGQKRIVLKNWSSIERNRDQLLDWINVYPIYNVGTLTKNNPFVDIDVTDSTIVKTLFLLFLKLIEPQDIPLVASRTGKAPKLAIPCKLPEGAEPFKKIKSSIYYNEEKVPQAVEILGDGQMCVMHGGHPDTKQPYTWDSETIPAVADLPVLSLRIIEQVFEKFEEIAKKKVEAGLWTVKAERSASITEKLLPIQKKQRAKSKTVYTIDQVKAILDDIPELEHDDWIKMGMGLHHQYEGGLEGELLWSYFSARFPKTFDANEIHKRYATLNKDPSAPGITFGTVVNYRNVALAKLEPSPIWELPDTLPVLPTAPINPISPNTKNLAPSTISTTSATNITATTPSTSTPSTNNTNTPSTNTTPPANTTVASSGGKPPTWYDGWFFLTAFNKMFNSLTKEMIKPEAFNFLFAHELVAIGELKGSPSSYLSRLNLIHKFSAIAYIPGSSRMLTIDNKKYVNSYNEYIPKGIKPSMHTPPTLLIDMIYRMVPDINEHDILMNFLAFIVQNPGKKINWSAILLGVPGTGKTTMLEIMRIALGPVNAKPVNADLFTNSFNSYAEGSMFVFVEEIKVSGDNRHRLLDKVKSIITNNVINITRKGFDSYDCRNVTSYMLGTNYPDALPIDDEDRRYAVIQTVLDLSQDEFTDVYNFLEDEDNHHDIREWLMTHPILPGFNPRGRAPKTNATIDMVANTEDLLISKIQDAIEKDTPLVNKSLISFGVLRDLVADEMALIQDKSFSPRLRNKLIQMHYTRAGVNKRTYSINHARHTLFKPDINLERQLQLPHNHFEVALNKLKKDSKK